MFYEKINGAPPTDKRYLNVLKLADEVQAAFGRNVLDHILRTEIPDKDYQPSQLHEKLMQLPWLDVFTTNYDTLLERTTEYITNQRFDVVINKEDLVYSAKPRIIKLHGSFPSERPFIITEDDYRRYPKEFAPFVNTVQQSLLENTLCLLGFSSDDPNFLQWIGWIRDNLGKENSPKIYLIGILTLSVAQKKLLEQRNIIPLDLSHCKNVNGSNEKALSLFLDFLHKEGKVEENLGWPEKSQFFHFKHSQDIVPQIASILGNWISIRKKYPNWLIVPEDRREVLKNYTEDIISFVYNLSKVGTPVDIQFLYEFNWRIEKCLIPIYNDLIEHYESVINNYNPFPNQIKIKNAITPDSKNKKELDWEEITFKWFELQLSMMRFYREEGFHEKWQLIATRLSKLIEKFGPELQSRYFYERCLYSLFALNIAEVRKELESWTTNGSLPFWEAKRAGLLAEIGDVIKAEKILEASLKTIRNRLNLSPIVNDYSNVSKEAYIMQLLKYVKKASSYIRGVYFIPEDISKSYTERWNTLVQYKCDPWSELKIFKIHLDKEPVEFIEREKKHGFDIGRILITHHFGGTDKYALIAFSYLKYIEEIGIPYRLPGITFGKEAAEGAIKHIAKYSPYWAFTTFVRIGDSKLADSIFDRKSISRMDSENIDRQINEYLSVLEKSVSEIKNGDTFRNTTFAISLSTVIPEILSRLCIKSNHELKLKLLSYIKKVFASEIRDRYRGIANLTKRLIKSFSKSDQYQIIPILLEFPILPKLHHLIDNEYIDPFEYIEINKKILKKVQKIKIEDDKIKELMEIAKKTPRERQNALNRLIKLWELDCLSKKQTDQLGELLWSKKEEKSGFPKDTKYYYFAFINLPHPSNVNPEQLLREYIYKTEFQIQANKQGKGVSMTGGNIRSFQEINGTSNSNINYTWHKEDIRVLIKKSVEWWDADKKYLKEKNTSHFFGSIKEEFMERFTNLISLYSNIFGPNYKLIDESQKKELQRILNEFEEFRMLNNEATASCYYLLPRNKDKIYTKIYENLFSKSKSKIDDALKGVIKLIELNIDNIDNLVLTISEQIRNRSEIGLVSFIDVMTLVINDYPDFINDKIFTNMKIGLSHLISETEILSQDSTEIVINKISYKIGAAKLTVALNNYFNWKRIKIPEYINKWKTLRLNKNEFSEIRKIWEDA